MIIRKWKTFIDQFSQVIKPSGKSFTRWQRSSARPASQQPVGGFFHSRVFIEGVAECSSSQVILNIEKYSLRRQEKDFLMHLMIN